MGQGKNKDMVVEPELGELASSQFEAVETEYGVKAPEELVIFIRRGIPFAADIKTQYAFGETAEEIIISFFLRNINGRSCVIFLFRYPYSSIIS